MKSRINIFFSAVLFLATLTTLQAMDLPGAKRIGRWVTRAGQMLTGTRSTANAGSQLTVTNDPNPFEQLTKADQGQIILLLSIYGTAQSLEAAAQTINSLAQVNRGLNQLINDPGFCSELTKYLAHKFNTTNEKVWSALQTQCAKETLTFQSELRKDLRYLCMKAKEMSPDVVVRSLRRLLNYGADLNYVYKNEGPALIIAIYYGSYDLARALIESGANPLATDTEGKSALEIAKEFTTDNGLIFAIEQAIAKLEK